MAGRTQEKSWKGERASVSHRGKERPRSNKFSGSDKGEMPQPGERDRIWVGGYTRGDGRHVDGYFRSAPDN